MANYQEAKVELTNTQLNRFKSAVESKAETTLRITKKNVQDEELSHELFLTTRRKTKNKKCLHQQYVDGYKP